MGPIHPIYSVRDKCKVDAEVIDVRTTDGAKGLRYQLVGRHPEDGTTVTTFCSESVAEDFKKQLEILPHGLAAEGITILEDSAEQPAADHLPESTAEVMSADGTPIEDDIEEYIEDPIIGSASEGTLTTVSESEEVEVLAAEGPDPAAYDPLTESPVEESPLDEGPSPETFDSEFVQLYETTITKPEIMKKLKSAGIKPVDVSEIDDELFGIRIESSDVKSFQKEFNKKDWTGMFEFEAEEFGGFDVSLSNSTPIDSVIVEAPIGHGVTQNLGAEAETFGEAGIDIELPSQILVETPDSDQLIVPDPDLFPQGGGRVLGQQTGKVNATPLHAEDEDYGSLIINLDGGWSIGNPDDLLILPLKGKEGKWVSMSDSQFIEDNLGAIQAGLQEGNLGDWIKKIDGDDWETSFNPVDEKAHISAEYDEYDDESRYERADVDRYEYERGKAAGEDAPTFFKN